VELIKRWTDIGEWTEFEVPETGPATFWKRILAGFPHQFEIEFNQPDAVRNVSVQLAGNTGGTALAILGDEGIFRARIESRRDATWDAGPVTVTYTPIGNSSFPKWGNDLELVGEVVILGEEAAPTGLHVSPKATEGVDFGFRQSFSIKDHAEGDLEMRFRAGLVAPVQTNTIQYPNGSISVGAGKTRSSGTDVSYSITGSGFSIRVENTISESTFISRDRDPPGWPESSALDIVSADESGMVVSWSEATDDMWVKSYIVHLDGQASATLDGDQKETALSGLTPGQTYEIAVQAWDVAGKPSTTRLTRSVQFSGSATAATNETHLEPVTLVVVDKPEEDSRHPIAEGETDSAVKVFLNVEGNWTGNITTLADVYL